MATHSRILAWKIPWTEEPGGLQSMGRKESDMTGHLNNNRTLSIGQYLDHHKTRKQFIGSERDLGTENQTHHEDNPGWSWSNIIRKVMLRY